MGRIVGIDLGTSTSEIAHFQHGEPFILTNHHEQPITPSAVWASPSGELITGHDAYQQPGAVRQYKREMGKDERFTLGNHSLSPEECSALLLKYLVKCGQERLREEIDRAVITVPANWKEPSRRATEEAGRLAGLQVERLINEPTAAAMAFGARPDADGKTIAVYDLGGGTFDVTILRIRDRVFDVVTSVGDEKLGGSDIDTLLVEYVIAQTAERTGYTHRLKEDLNKDHDLRQECEKAKKNLSFVSETVIRLPSFGLVAGRPIASEVPVDRARLERLIEPLVARSINYLKEALRRARLDAGAIDDLVMVGGSTRIPLVRRRVAEMMGKEPNTSSINPDEAVALGAAIQAGILDQDVVEPNSFLALDNVNHNLGVETATMVGDHLVPGKFAAIITKDSKVPISRTSSFTTVVDNQRQISVRCFQGNHEVAVQNALVGEPILIDGLPPRPAGEVEINITFSLSVSEVLNVGVQIQEAGISEVRSFALSRDRFSERQMTERRQLLDSMWQRSELAGRYRRLIERAEETLGRDLPAATRSSLEAALNTLKSTVAEGDTERAEQADLALSNLLFELD